MQKSIYISIWIAIAIVYLLGAVFIDVMDVDAAQYASIAQEMESSGSWLLVKHKYADYLDKPPLLFWLSAFFYKILGVNHFAYRLPSLLATALGLFATYRLGKKLYNQEVGQIAALLLASTQAWFLFNQDIRTDTLLAAFVITSVWLLCEYMDSRKWYYFVAGFAAIGLSMLAKGPLGAVIPTLALSAYWLGRNEWRNFFHWEWLLGIVITLLVLSPMLYGLWLQWGSEGLYFFFWKQSFGRITGENSWRNDSGPLFFIHTFLWSFLPWAGLALYALGRRFATFWSKGATFELLTLGGFILPFLALSLSTYKLPHYIFPLYPFMAILVAKELAGLLSDRKGLWYKVLYGFQLFLNFLAWALVLVLCLWAFPNAGWWIWLIIVAGAIIFIFSQFHPLFANSRLLSGGLISFISLNLVLSLHFYPTILQYQSGSQAARFIIKNNINPDEVACYGLYPNSLDFYMKGIAQAFLSPGDLIRSVSAQPLWVFTNEEGKKALEQGGAIIEQTVPFEHFHITKLSLKFINPQTRPMVLGKAYLLRIKGVLG